MKTIQLFCRLSLIAGCIFFAGNAMAQEGIPCTSADQTHYFGVEIKGTLCGYSVESFCNGTLESHPVRYEQSDITLKMTLLGAGVDINIKALFCLDAFTDRARMIKYNILTGNSSVLSETRITGDTAYYVSISSGVQKKVTLPKGVIVGSQLRYPFLVEDSRNTSQNEKTFKVYEPVRGEIVEKSYVRKGEEDIRLADSTFRTVVFEEADHSSGVTTTLWINKTDGFNVKANVAGRNIYLTDKSVIGKISMADMNNVLFARVNKIIPDIMNLSGMKVKAHIESFGEKLTSESLNFQGQKFTGTITGSLVEGVFENETRKYDGTHAPSFPPDFTGVNALKKYLEPELMIESDDPLIISEAKKITAGSENSWKAAVRLSKWVAENITGALPGGGSAINTLKTREAECGGHSRILAAFCRAVGIPARMVVGCMYSTYYGGSFGQHAWTEVYMGEAGWIPVDATIGENDYIDAGHIRLGEKANFQPESMEIIDFQTGTGNKTAGLDTVPDRYKTLTGKYTEMDGLKVFKVQYNNGSLSVDIPGQMVLQLNEPDSTGEWFPKMTRQLSFSFLKNQTGRAVKMFIRQVAPMQKVSAPGITELNVPDGLRKYLGNYTFTPAKLSLDLTYSDGFLTSQDPLHRSKNPVRFSDKGGFWGDDQGNYEIRFEDGPDNQVKVLKLTVLTTLLRGEPVTNALEPVIEESGIAAGIKKYTEIKKTNTRDYICSDIVLNRLGHQLLSKGRMDDALEIFRLNVKENPGSFMANDSLAETYLKKGENKLACQYFMESVKLNPEYEYGKKMIEELKSKKQSYVLP